MTSACSHRIGAKGLKVCADCGARLRGAALTEARTARAVAEKEAFRNRLRALRDAQDDEKDRVDRVLAARDRTSAIDARFGNGQRPARPAPAFRRRPNMLGLLSSLAFTLTPFRSR